MKEEKTLPTKWDYRFMALADHVSEWSKDKSTKVGAVIVNKSDLNPISIGYNGFPKGIVDDINERHERPLKYEYSVHAEQNAIANAAKNGQTTKECSIYVNFYPCSRCAGLIVNAGIIKVYCKNKPDFNNERWGDIWKISDSILREANIEIIYL
ncbi:MAG: deoxycytidylate deaminase [bacterium]